jgi:hypothetical protein
MSALGIYDLSKTQTASWLVGINFTLVCVNPVSSTGERHYENDGHRLLFSYAKTHKLYPLSDTSCHLPLKGKDYAEKL